MTPSPKLSIGLPVYNGARTLDRAIETLLAQSKQDFELVISDNSSTDGTDSIIRRHAARDRRIRHIHQHRNIGAYANFKFLLDQADGEYFMWAGADDEWHPDFVSANLAYLESHMDYVASVSRVHIEGIDNDRLSTQGTFALDADVDTNIRDFVLRPGANSRFYGIHRTMAVREVWTEEIFWAGDWAMICRLLHHGKYHEVSRVLMTRGNSGASRDMYKSIRSLELSWWNTWFPLLTYSLKVLHYPAIRNSPRALAWLAWLNLNTTRKMMMGWGREHWNYDNKAS